MEIIISHRITAVLLSLLMLLSSTGFSMDMHYCQDNLQGISFLGNTGSCLSKKSTSCCPKSKKTCHDNSNELDNIDEDNCCHNESIVINKSDFDATSPQIATGQDIKIEFVDAFVTVYVFNNILKADSQKYIKYKPPLPDRDVQVLYQVFLI